MLDQTRKVSCETWDLKWPWKNVKWKLETKLSMCLCYVVKFQCPLDRCRKRLSESSRWLSWKPTLMHSMGAVMWNLDLGLPCFLLWIVFQYGRSVWTTSTLIPDGPYSLRSNAGCYHISHRDCWILKQASWCMRNYALNNQLRKHTEIKKKSSQQR